MKQRAGNDGLLRGNRSNLPVRIKVNVYGGTKNLGYSPDKAVKDIDKTIWLGFISVKWTNL